jgi:tRNA threonylcarbamoyladenosine biosynthesis protein TsaE
LKLFLKDEGQTTQLGRNLAKCLDVKSPCVVYLNGDLGTGKTALARGLVKSFGYDKVKSPTYSIVESYQNDNINIHHLDCYRLAEAEELEMLGIRDYEQDSIILVEWAENGLGFLPKSDLVITLEQDKMHRNVLIGAQTNYGKKIKRCLEENL